MESLSVEEEINQELDFLSISAHKGCGLIYELYERRLFSKIYNYISREKRLESKILIQANDKFGYTTKPDCFNDNNKEHECCHGLDEMTCPCGCFK